MDGLFFDRPGKRPGTTLNAKGELPEMADKDSYGRLLDPHPIEKGLTVADMVDQHLFAYNAARLREASQLLARKVMQNDVTVGMTLSGALTPTGLGTSALVPLVDGGFIDWIVSPDSNLFHDIPRSLVFEL